MLMLVYLVTVAVVMVTGRIRLRCRVIVIIPLQSTELLHKVLLVIVNCDSLVWSLQRLLL